MVQIIIFLAFQGYYQILSDIIRYYQILSDIIRYYQILSDIVRYFSDSYGIIDHLKVSEVYEVTPFLSNPETSQATGYPLAYVAAKIALGDMAPVEC